MELSSGVWRCVKSNSRVRPKVIEFGLATALGRQMSDATMLPIAQIRRSFSVKSPLERRQLGLGRKGAHEA